MEQGPLKKEHWRKSAQWSALVRKHAQVVADDVQVADVFSKTCRAGIDKKTGVEHKCISDEVSVNCSSRKTPCAACRELLPREAPAKGLNTGVSLTRQG